MQESELAANYNLNIIGFSKGCVVLNQFLHEFDYYMKTSECDPEDQVGIVSKIKDMYWLDGGHSGGGNTWVTSRDLLETFSKLGNLNFFFICFLRFFLGITPHIHVSPYQIKDDRRPWIKKEEKVFFNTLCSLKVQVQRVVHFANVPPSIDHHFSILNAFHQNCN